MLRLSDLFTRFTEQLNVFLEDCNQPEAWRPIMKGKVFVFFKHILLINFAHFIFNLHRNHASSTMIKPLLVLLLILFSISGFSQVQQTGKSVLTIEKIMQNPDQWMGTLPENVFWSEDSKTVYFNWKQASLNS